MAKKTATTHQKLKETEQALKRALADYHNLERRVKEEREALLRFASEEIITKFLPIFDDLEKATKHLKESGLEMIISKINDLLKEEGIKEIEAQGQKFDPNSMEAIESVQGEDGIVVEVVRIGYEIDGKVLRPALVKVGKSKISEDEKKAEKASQFGDYA